MLVWDESVDMNFSDLAFEQELCATLNVGSTLSEHFDYSLLPSGLVPQIKWHILNYKKKQ